MDVHLDAPKHTVEQSCHGRPFKPTRGLQGGGQNLRSKICFYGCCYTRATEFSISDCTLGRKMHLRQLVFLLDLIINVCTVCGIRCLACIHVLAMQQAKPTVDGCWRVGWHWGRRRGRYCTGSIDESIFHQVETAEVDCVDIVVLRRLSNYWSHYRFVYLHRWGDIIKTT